MDESCSAAHEPLLNEVTGMHRQTVHVSFSREATHFLPIERGAS
jgi:hypothetical protein